MKLIAPATVIQAAVPGMLRNVPDSFHSDTMETFENNAKLCYSKLKDTPGITPVMPAGAMYMMVSDLCEEGREGEGGGREWEGSGKGGGREGEGRGREGGEREGKMLLSKSVHTSSRISLVSWCSSPLIIIIIDKP